MMRAAPSICVFCGSREGASPAYHKASRDFGAALAAEDWSLVYGAGDVGLMGAVAGAAQEGGGAAFGVIPAHLVNREAAKQDLSRLVVTENMHERKKVMFMNSDAIVVLPGGAGSLDEFFEVLTWRQLDLHEKPIFLLNTNGYWDPLIQLVNHVIEHGFADATLRAFMAVADDVPALMDGLKRCLA